MGKSKHSSNPKKSKLRRIRLKSNLKSKLRQEVKEVAEPVIRKKCKRIERKSKLRRKAIRIQKARKRKEETIRKCESIKSQCKDFKQKKKTIAIKRKLKRKRKQNEKFWLINDTRTNYNEVRK